MLALVLGRFGGQPDVVAFGFFGVLGVALAAIDIAVQRLPDLLTLPAYPILITLLAGAAIAGHDFAALLRALLGGLALAGAYLLLALARPGQLGGGDIKLAGVAGLALGWLGWPILIAGAALGFVLSAWPAWPCLPPGASRCTARSASAPSSSAAPCSRCSPEAVSRRSRDWPSPSRSPRAQLRVYPPVASGST